MIFDHPIERIDFEDKIAHFRNTKTNEIASVCLYVSIIRISHRFINKRFLLRRSGERMDRIRECERN